MKPPDYNRSLAETHPDVAKQWHPTLNGALMPNDFTYGSNKKVWWKCDKGKDHEWDAPIFSRSNGRGCSVCSGRKVVLSNCLATVDPELAKEWHPTKNGDLTPFDVSEYSNKKAWWKCDKGDDHDWDASIASRSDGRGCSVCDGKTVILSNCLATVNPELAKEWHPTKNGDLTPFDISEHSNKKAWWKCDKGDDHEWDASIDNRSNGSGCPVCSGQMVVKSNCLSTTHPEIASEWHPSKNGELTPDDFTSGSNKKVWWKCDKGDDHIFENPIKARRKVNCPVCYGRVIVKSNSLVVTHPQIAKEWHPTKNQDLTPDQIGFGSAKKVWWKCIEGEDHEWLGSVHSRTREIISDKTPTRCPICSGRKTVKSNCLSTTHPELASEWHPTKNGDITPFDITYGSRTYIWWKCDKGIDHIYRSLVNSRTSQDTGCTVCSGQMVVKSNCLSTTHPEIASEWHPSKNGELTPDDFTSGSHKKVWWKCDKGDDHEWKTAIGDRSKRNCPYCTLTPQSKQELTITFELIQFFKQINPKGFKTRVKGKLWSIDIYIPKLKLGIEFDGSYWHKDKSAMDKLKTEQIEDDGIEIFRIREEPLLRIFDDDIMSKQPFNAKQVTNDILTQIMSRYNLDTKKVAKIKDYQAKEELQNERGLDKYIDKILTEKAEKKSSKQEDSLSKDTSAGDGT